MVAYNASYESVCQGQSLGQILFPGLWNFTSAMSLCHAVQGRMIQFHDEEEEISASQVLKKTIWIGSIIKLKFNLRY